MDIYSDLAQSSTPQTTTVLAKMIPTQLAPPLSTSATSLTQTTKSTSTTTSQSSIIKPSLHTSSSVAALAEPANKKAKTNDNPSSTGRKKEKSSDKRWSKRFVWPDEVSFVSIIVICVCVCTLFLQCFGAKSHFFVLIHSYNPEHSFIETLYQPYLR